MPRPPGSNEHFEETWRKITSQVLSHGRKGFDKEFEHVLNKLDETEILGISEIIEKNRLTMPVYEGLNSLNSGNAVCLRECLKPYVLENRSRNRFRNKILREVSSLFQDAGVDYAVFKTVNRLNAVGVDIDLIISPEDYELCVEALLSNGFYSIDDLGKKYATGFMQRGNPIIMDMHTDLAILGVRYFNPKLLLNNIKRKEIEQEASCRSFPINLVDETFNAVIIMIHGVIKESTIRVDEVAEIKPCINNALQKIVATEKHGLTASIFSYIVERRLGLDEFKKLTCFNSSFTQNFTKTLMHKQSKTTAPPIKLPAILSLAAFLNYLKEKNQLLTLSKLFYNLGFSRNAAHIGKKVFKSLYT